MSSQIHRDEEFPNETSTQWSDENPAPWSEAEDWIDPYHAYPDAPPGYRLGERTRQARPDGPVYWHEDYEGMLRKFDIPEFDPHKFLEIDQGAVVYPDILIHRRNPSLTPTPKATDALIRAKKGKGKTTFLKRLAIRLLENNNERVIHRGRTDDSGWLELRWWATLWLPENATIEAEWVYEEDDDKTREPVEDLEEIVREVRYYEDVYDLVDQLAETPVSTYHVVYPDPSFAGCEDVCRRSNKTRMLLPFTPEWETSMGESATPLPQWWIAFLLTQLEHGHFDAFMSWLCDESHQIFGPPNPKEDAHLTDKKFDLSRQILNEARKRMLSWYLAVQKEKKMDYRILGEVTHRIYLADGRPNPHKNNRSTLPYGWDIVPMEGDFLSNRNLGRGLCFIEAQNRGFAEFQWDDFEAHPDDENRWLQIELREPTDQVRTSTSGPTEETGPDLEYDERFLELYEQGNQLFVKKPGRGVIDLDEPSIEAELEAPPAESLEQLEQLSIDSELRRSDDGDHWLVTGEAGSTDESGRVRTVETVFARIPISGYQPEARS